MGRQPMLILYKLLRSADRNLQWPVNLTPSPSQKEHSLLCYIIIHVSNYWCFPWLYPMHWRRGVGMLLRCCETSQKLNYSQFMNCATSAVYLKINAMWIWAVREWGKFGFLQIVKSVYISHQTTSMQTQTVTVQRSICPTVV